MSLHEVATAGDRRETLLALRDRLASAIDSTESARDIAALSKQLTDVLTAINDLPDAQVETAADEIAKRREERKAKKAAKEETAAVTN